MSSILTNTSAMVALQTLKNTNMNLTKAQGEISTGKSIASAKDNSAIWAISKVMEADVNGFKAISDSLSLGESTVAVARQASETVTDLLTQIKGKVVAAQEDNVDRGKIQADIAALTKQVTSVVNAAQFNGLNLVDGNITTTNTDGNTGIDVLASLNRDASGTVSSSSIGVASQNLSLTGGTALTSAAASVGTDPGTAGVIDANMAAPAIRSSWIHSPFSMRPAVQPARRRWPAARPAWTIQWPVASWPETSLHSRSDPSRRNIPFAKAIQPKPSLPA